MRQKNSTANTIELTFKPAWNAVFAVAFGVSGLIISEFLPVRRISFYVVSIIPVKVIKLFKN